MFVCHHQLLITYDRVCTSDAVISGNFSIVFSHSWYLQMTPDNHSHDYEYIYIMPSHEASLTKNIFHYPTIQSIAHAFFGQFALN